MIESWLRKFIVEQTTMVVNPSLQSEAKLNTKLEDIP